MTVNWLGSERLKAIWSRIGIENLAGILALLAIGVGLVSTILQSWVPVSDMALMELHVRDVPFHFPLVGAYSRFGWSHPGPVQYVILAVPYRLTGGASWSIPAATVLLNIAAVGVAWRVARSLDRLAGSVILLGAMTLIAGGDPAVLRNWWNPNVGVVLTFTLIVAAWGAAERRAWPTFALLPIASLLVQSHVGYAAVVAPVVATGLVLMAWRRSAADADRPPCWTHAGWGAALAALMWLPALIDQIRSDPGNLSALLRSGAGSGEPAGIGFALRLLSENLGVPPAWAGGNIDQALGTLNPTWVVPVLLLIPLGALIVAVRNRSRPQIRALAVAAAGTGGAIVGTTYVHGAVFTYLVPWFAPTVAALISISLWVLLAQLPVGLRIRPRQVIAAATVVVAGIVAVQQMPAAAFDAGTTEAVRDLSSALITDAAGSPVFVTSESDFSSAAVYGGVVLAAERSGLDVRVPEAESQRFGAHRTGSVGQRVQYLIAQPESVATLRGDGWKVITEHDPFTAGERSRLRHLRAEIDRLGSGPGSPGSDKAIGELVDQIEKIERTRITAVLLRR